MGGQSNVAIPNTYQFANQPLADKSATSAIQNYSANNNATSQLPLAQGYYNQTQTPGYNSAGVQGAGAQVMNAGQGQIGVGQNIQNMGLDPQSALYNRTQQQLTDQTRAGLAARGLDMTPYGAGVEGQTMGNFNIDWQNQQLQRAIQGAQAGGGVMQQGGAMAQQGANMQMAVPQFNNAQSLSGLNALQSAGRAADSSQQQTINDWMQYLSGGNAASSTALQGAQLAINQNQANQQASSSALGGIGSLFGTAASFLPF